MEKIIYDLEIETQKNKVFLSQSNFGCDNSRIILMYDQIDIIINWLIDAKAEIEREIFESKKGEEKNA